MILTKKCIEKIAARGEYSKLQKELIAKVLKVKEYELEGVDVEEYFYKLLIICKSNTQKIRRDLSKFKKHGKDQYREYMKAKKSNVEENAKARYKKLMKKLQQNGKPKPEIINSVSPSDGRDWSWKPEAKDIPALIIKTAKKSKNRGKNKAARQRVTRQDNDKFYASREWRELRVRVFEKYECACMMCGRSPKVHKIIIHVDHIKPRSHYPELSLEFNNLQLLCEDCNLGKSNKYETDWRPAVAINSDSNQEDVDRELMLEASKRL